MTRRESTDKRHKRIRSKVEGTPERPRLAVFRSNNHIYAQVIDDTGATTLAATSTLNPEIRAALNGDGGNVEGAKLVGAKIAELCKQANIEKVCFDRGGFRYHGRVQALADAAREAGLNF
ncbi:50S ribosomal L18 [Micractinium conductrix]|uniref:Large ribosomal subunit protein uL18c n=1 Tax=Micractinium conductrix TaxID=554055 RepID=A0A2P6V6N0_9CHLO|nr:50S ribosomal L18 [Micractinium conductrix]|eukprot:PSC69746.1 50S ribosomal L18 [Micractinium conductrix]